MFYLHVDTSVIWRSVERAPEPSRDIFKHGARSHAQCTEIKVHVLIKKIFQIRCLHAHQLQEYSHVHLHEHAFFTFALSCFVFWLFYIAF